MDEKYDDRYEKQIVLMAENRLETKNYRVFDYRARVVKSERFPGLVRQ